MLLFSEPQGRDPSSRVERRGAGGARHVGGSYFRRWRSLTLREPGREQGADTLGPLLLALAALRLLCRVLSRVCVLFISLLSVAFAILSCFVCCVMCSLFVAVFMVSWRSLPKHSPTKLVAVIHSRARANPHPHPRTDTHPHTHTHPQTHTHTHTHRHTRRRRGRSGAVFICIM